MFAIKKVEKLTKINNNNKSFIELDCSASIKEYCKFMAQAGEVAKKKKKKKKREIELSSNMDLTPDLLPPIVHGNSSQAIPTKTFQIGFTLV